MATASSFSLSTSEAVINETSVTVTINKSVDTYKHTIVIYLGDYRKELVKLTTASTYKFTPPKEMSSYMGSSKTATGSIKVKTYKKDGTKVGEVSKTMTFKLSDTAKPVVDEKAPFIEIIVLANNTVNGLNIANKTTFTVKVLNAYGKNGAVIEKYKYTGGGLDKTVATPTAITTGKLTAGTYTFKVTVTDSKGRTSSDSKEVKVVHNEYSSPIVSGSAYRCLENGTEVDEGENVAIEFAWEISSFAFENIKKYTLEYIQEGDTTFTKEVDNQDLLSIKGSMKYIFSNKFQLDKMYRIRLTIDDGTSKTIFTETISTLQSILNIEKKGIGVGKLHGKGCIDIAGDLYSRGKYRLLSVDDSATFFIGDESIQSLLTSKDNPKWFDGKNNYEIFNSKNCTVTRNAADNKISAKFDNGFLIETCKKTVRTDFENKWGSLFISSTTVSWDTFLQTFITTPVVFVSAHTTTGGVMTTLTSMPTTTTGGVVSLLRPDYVSSKSDVYIDFVAIGRWK